MRLKKLLAVTLGLSMMFAVPAYANDADAVAAYQQMEQKSKEMTDMDAYYDYTMQMSSASGSMDMRLEMNVKANQMLNPEQIRMNMYSRVTMGQIKSTGNGPGEAETLDLSQTPVTFNMYYENGMYYMDMLGQKVKYPMPLTDLMEQVQSTTNLTETGLTHMRDMKLRMEGEDRIVSFTMDMTEMNGLVQQILSMQGMPQSANMENISFAYHDVTGEYIIDPNGFCKKVRMKMVMDMTAEGETMTVTMDGDVGFANPGQPVTITTPNLAEYVTLEQMEAEMQQLMEQ